MTTTHDEEKLISLAIVADKLACCEQTVLALCREDAVELFGGRLHPIEINHQPMFALPDILHCLDGLKARQESNRLTAKEREWARQYCARDLAYLEALEKLTVELQAEIDANNKTARA